MDANNEERDGGAAPSTVDDSADPADAQVLDAGAAPALADLQQASASTPATERSVDGGAAPGQDDRPAPDAAPPAPGDDAQDAGGAPDLPD
ncbi:MAG TPA: hypothetical protein VNP92_27570 [Actinophytocola sp.]|nr:hypothetical protein [Actinophytocola sp.]